MYLGWHPVLGGAEKFVSKMLANISRVLRDSARAAAGFAVSLFIVNF